MKKYISLLLATAATIACTKVALEDNSPIESIPQDGNTENIQGEPSGEKIIISLAETKVSLDENRYYQFDGDEVIYVKARTKGAVAKLQKSATEPNTFTGVFNGLLGDTSETFDFYYNCTDENANVVTDEKGNVVKVQNGQPWLAAIGVKGDRDRSTASEYSYKLSDVKLNQLGGYVCLALNSDYKCTVDFHTLTKALPNGETTISGIQFDNGNNKPYFVNIKSGMTGGFYLTVTYEGQKMYTSYGTTAEITSNQIIKTKKFEAFSISGQLVDDESRTFQSTYNVYRNSGADAANGIDSDIISSGEATFTMTGISKTIRNRVSLKNITVTFNDKVSASVEPTTPTTPDWTETKSCTIKIPQTYGHNKWGPVTVTNAVAVFSTPDGNDYQVSFANPSMTRYITGLPFKCEDFSNEEGNWKKSTYAMAFETSGIYFYQGTTSSPYCTLKQNIYSPSEVSVSMDAEFYKESGKTPGFTRAQLELSLGTLILSTKDTKTQTLSINGTISGNRTLKGSFSYGGVNHSAKARIGKIHILYK